MSCKVHVPIVFIVLVLLISCAGEGPPRPGTPGFFWIAAEESFIAGDYVKTAEHLERVTDSQSDYTAKARPWRLVTLAGLALSFAEIADQYEHGARNNKANPTPFRKSVADNRFIASRYALQFGEAYVAFQKAQPEGAVALVFEFPPRGNLAMPPQMTKAAEGAILSDADAQTTRTAMLQRGVLEAVCRAAGAPGDAPKAMEMLKTRPVEVPRGTFEMAMAQSLHRAAQLYAPLKLSRPDRQEFFLTQAQSALKLVTDSKEAKELSARVEKELKQLPGRK